MSGKSVVILLLKDQPAHAEAVRSAPGNQGYLPDRYADLLPRRITCGGPLCGKNLNPAAQNQ